MFSPLSKEIYYTYTLHNYRFYLFSLTHTQYIKKSPLFQKEFSIFYTCTYIKYTLKFIILKNTLKLKNLGKEPEQSENNKKWNKKKCIHVYIQNNISDFKTFFVGH